MVIGIIERYETVKEKEPFFFERYFLTKYFKDIFEELNVILFPIMSGKNIEEIAQMCDGLIVTGSENDVHPQYYGEKICKKTNFKIDEYAESAKIMKIFIEQRKPILGICAGIQEINVFFGGSLYQNIENHNLKEKKHKIRIEKDSFLADVCDEPEILVNSFHHQAIKQVAQDFKITAISEDGIVEAIEKDNILAVQWHPEQMRDINFFQVFLKKYLR